MFIAGDPSGDLHAAEVLRQLKQLEPDCMLLGIGGPAMQSVGFQTLFPFEPFNRMGYLEVIVHLPFFLGVKRKLLRFMKEHRPSCLVCVDYSGFNIPMMKAARNMGIPVIWYIAPMVWAWKKKRAAVLARYASHICCIFPFEVASFLPYTNNVSFVGNPLAEKYSRQNLFPKKKKTISKKPLLAIVPGSRRQEIQHNLPPMVGAYSLLKKKYPDLRAVISKFPALPDNLFISAHKEKNLSFHSGPLSELLEKADIALVTSGTATLETSFMEIPHVIVYRTSPITYAILKHFITITSIGLPNIIAEEAVAPECIQEYVTDKVLFDRISEYLDNSEKYRETAGKLSRIKTVLGAEKPSTAVAALVQKHALR